MKVPTERCEACLVAPKKGCRECRRLYMRGWYDRNKDRVVEGNTARQKKWRLDARADRRAEVNRLKSEPCTYCGRCFPPWVMQYDHRPGEKKAGNIATMVQRGMPLATILAEIAKCDLTCANCHADLTYRRAHGL